MFTGHGVRLYRGGYRYAFTPPLPIAHAITLRTSPPQGQPNTTLLGFRVCPQTPGRLKFFPKAPAKGFSLSTAAYFIFLNLFLLLHLPHSLFLTLFLLLHLPHSLFLTLFILLHLPYFIFFTNFLLLHPHNIII